LIGLVSEKVKVVMKRINKKKVVRSEGVPVEAWNILVGVSIVWLKDLFNKVLIEGKCQTIGEIVLLY